MNTLYFNLETLPDISGARQLYQLPDDLADKDVAKIIFHHHLHREGRDARFLRPFQSSIHVVAMLAVRDDIPSIQLLDTGDTSESALLVHLQQQMSRYPGRSQFWDEGRSVEALIKMRSLIHSVVMENISVSPLEQQLGMIPGEITIDQLANRMGFDAEQVTSDEMLWSAWRKEGMQVVRKRCLKNLLATVQIGLRQSYTSGDIDQQRYNEISTACSDLCKESC